MDQILISFVRMLETSGVLRQLNNQLTEALYQMLKLFQCTPELPDLTLIGGKGKPGPIRISMNVTDRCSLSIIHQSVTGIYEQIERIV